MKELITEHLVLRKAKLKDLESIYENIWSDKDIYNTMFFEPTNDLDSAKLRLIRTIDYQSKNYAYYVCLKNTDEAIGFAGIRSIEPNVYGEAGICIAKKYQGKGYGKEVLNSLEKLVFNTLKGERFLYSCCTVNDRSRNLCLSQGYKYLENKKEIRKYDNKEFELEFYYIDKKMYETRRFK